MTQTPTPTTAYREGTGAAVIILIPAYEPDEKLTDLVRRGTEAGLGTFVVVNDGSGPACAPVFQQVEALGAHVCHHEKNRGKGAAIKTGMTYIRETFPQAAGAVTADADGQHAVEDIQALAAEVRRKGESLILGVRSFDTDTVPWHSRAGNRITAAIFRLLTGIQCPDTQTGLRGIPAALFPLALATEGERYDYEMNFLIDAARQKVPLTMVPIRTIYLDDNKSSHFRVVRDSVLIYKKPVTFLLVSLLSSGTDLLAFWLLLRCLFGGQDHYIMLATILVEHDEQAVTTLGVVTIAIANINSIQPYDLALDTHIASLCPDGVLTGGVLLIGHVGDLHLPLAEIVDILCLVACAEGYGHHQKGYASIGPFRKSCHDR